MVEVRVNIDASPVRAQQMGTIKDLVDLTTQLANSMEDRRVASELNAIQSLILNVQSDLFSEQLRTGVANPCIAGVRAGPIRVEFAGRLAGTRASPPGPTPRRIP
jgi:hypothetical protein